MSKTFAYELSKELMLPGGSVRQVDSFSDGRFIVYAGGTLYVEQAVGIEAFNATALSVGGSATAGFALAPNELKVAIGIGDTVNICELLTGVCEGFAKPNFQFAWIDNRYLLVSASPQVGSNYINTVSILDTESPDLMNPDVQTLIDLPGTQAGVGLDSDQNLIVGAYSVGEGQLYTFDYAKWQSAWLSDTVLATVDGIFLGNALTAAYLGVDSWGDLFVGGGNLSGDPTAMLVSKTLVEAIKQGLETPFDETTTGVTEIAPPADCSVNFTQISVSIERNELYVTCYSNEQLRVYRKFSMQVPVPWPFVFILCILLICVMHCKNINRV